MPRPKSLIPKLCVDKTRNRAFCKVDGKFLVLGPAGSPEAQAAYGELLTNLARQGAAAAIASTRARGRAHSEPVPGILLADLFLRFVTEEMPKYSSAEQRCIKSAVKLARELYGETAAAEFGPVRLRTVRDAMIRKGWSRSFINREVKRLRLIIRWGVGWELVPASVADALSAVKSLGKGDSTASESKPRRAISEADVQAVRSHLCERHRDLVDLMLLTGCRPGEILSLSSGMIDRSDGIWRADLEQHKTAHKGKSRTLFFNKSAQLILRKYLQADPAARIFSLRGDTFSNAIKSACEIAYGMPAHLRKPGRELTAQQKADAKTWRRKHVWTPHWLRHTVATRLADEVGTEAAQRLLGHATTAMTLHYSRTAEKQAIEAAKRLG